MASTPSSSRTLLYLSVMIYDRCNFEMLYNRTHALAVMWSSQSSASGGRRLSKLYWTFLAWVSSFSLQVDLKVYSNELRNELHTHAQMYRNIPQCTQIYSKRPKCVHSRVPVLLLLQTDCVFLLSRRIICTESKC